LVERLTGSQEVRGSNPLTSTEWACENCNVFPGQRACLRWDFQARQMPTFEPLPDQGERPNQASHPVKGVRLQWLHSALATSRQWSSTRTTAEIKKGPPPRPSLREWLKRNQGASEQMRRDRHGTDSLAPLHTQPETGSRAECKLCKKGRRDRRSDQERCIDSVDHGDRPPPALPT
jgi:hypothetical protein